MDADEERAGCDHVAVGQRLRDPVFDLRIGGMAQQVSAEKIAGLDARGFERVDEVCPGEGRLRPHGDDEAEP